MANLSKTLHINSYQNRSSIVEVMIKNFGVFFMPHSVVCFGTVLIQGGPKSGTSVLISG